MTRTVLDRELKELDAQILQLGSLVDEALGKALEALADGDLAKAGMVIEGDNIIDSLRATVEEHTIRLLTLQQPLGGRDLRYLTSSLSIAGDLERMGDGAEGIAQIVLRMNPLSTGPATQVKIADPTADGRNNEVTEASIMHSMQELGREVRRVVQGTMKAFGDRDAKAARYIWEEDDVVDVRYHLVRHDLMTMMTAARGIPALQSDALILQRATYLLWIGHKLERIGDHCSNICERTIFFLEGDTNMHVDAQQDGQIQTTQS